MKHSQKLLIKLLLIIVLITGLTYLASHITELTGYVIKLID